MMISLKDRIFVAGSTGMAGSAICRSFLKRGYGHIDNGGMLLRPSRKELDLLNLNSVKKWFMKNKPNIVVLAAAKVGGILANSEYPADFLLDNLKIQTNVIETAWEFGVKRLLFLGSSCIYPKLAQQPIKEEYLLENYLEKTNEAYAIAKIAGLKLCEALRKQHNFDAISLMPTNLYGPKDNYHPHYSHVMASLIRKFCKAVENSSKEVICWGDGNPKREFLHVDDLGDAAIFCLENWDPNSLKAPKNSNGHSLNHLNVGTGVDITIKDLALLIAKLTKFEGEIKWDINKPNGTPRKQLEISNIKKLGWEPKISLKDGLKKTIESYIKENNN